MVFVWQARDCMGVCLAHSEPEARAIMLRDWAQYDLPMTWNKPATEVWKEPKGVAVFVDPEGRV